MPLNRRRFLVIPYFIVDGALTIPKGPGVGLADPAAVLKNAEPLE